MSDRTSPDLRSLFRKTPVLSMPQLERTLAPRSRRSVFRDLTLLGYLSSYTHTGRYYTLASIPEFDADGLWRWEQVGFSRDGTLKATVQRIVQASDAGRTQRELQLRLGVRVHNPLLGLVEDDRLRRESFKDQYVYLAADRGRSATQLERRRTLCSGGATAPAGPALDVEVLLELIHGVRLPAPDAAKVAARLAARGIRASVGEVAAVLEQHGVKKTAPSRSRRSKR